ARPHRGRSWRARSRLRGRPVRAISPPPPILSFNRHYSAAFATLAASKVKILQSNTGSCSVNLKATTSLRQSLCAPLPTLWSSLAHPRRSRRNGKLPPLVFSTIKQDGFDAMTLLTDAQFFSARRQISSLAATHRLPAMYESRESVADGGLISYGASISDLTRRTAVFVVKVLNGAKPADLPIEQPTKFELVINLKTAKALGLDIP